LPGWYSTRCTGAGRRGLPAPNPPGFAAPLAAPGLAGAYPHGPGWPPDIDSSRGVG